MSDYVDPFAVYQTSGIDPAITVPAKTGIVVDPAQYGPSNLAVNVSPPKFDPNNPLGLTAAAPGYLPADQRAPPRDPDLGWSDSMQTGGPGVPLSSLPVDLQNSVTKAQQDWANMDQKYWSAREQNPLPLVLGAAGLIAAPFALGALGLGGAAGAAGAAGEAGAAGAGLAGAGATAAGAGALGAAGAGATLSELVVTAAAQGLSIPAIAATLAIPAATVGSILSSNGGAQTLQGSPGNDTLSVTPPAATPDPALAVNPPPVEGLTVTAPAAGPSLAVPLAAGAGIAGLGALAAGSGGGGLPAGATAGVPEGVPAATGPNAALGDTSLGNPTPTSLMNAIKSGDPSQIGSWIAANPLQAAQLGLLGASALSTLTAKPAGGSGSSGNYTPVALPASFSATSPHFALAGRGDPRIMPAQDWTKYGQGPEQSFFTGINQPAPIVNLTVPKPPHTYARGGFAVKGPGDGRSDSIDARLSDGEYVMDAETVALLGNGSNKAGADKLDQFRVNLRKDKGRNLARGDFSVHAKDPSSYMTGAH